MVFYAWFTFWFRGCYSSAAAGNAPVIEGLLSRIENSAEYNEPDELLSNIAAGVSSGHSRYEYYNAWFNLHVFLGYFDNIVRVFENYIKNRSADEVINVSQLFFLDCSLLLNLVHYYVLEAPRKRKLEDFEHINTLRNLYDTLLTKHAEQLKCMAYLQRFLLHLSGLIKALKKVVYRHVLDTDTELQEAILKVLSLTLFYKAIEENFTLPLDCQFKDNLSQDLEQAASVELDTAPELNVLDSDTSHDLRNLMIVVRDTYLFIKKQKKLFFEGTVIIKNEIDCKFVLSTVRRYFRFMKLNNNAISGRKNRLIRFFECLRLKHMADDMHKLKRYFRITIRKKIENSKEWNAMFDVWMNISE
ncbi:hypothetical protein VCUG_02268 [Vavraia culicis subsp. floridensis]|uniref:Uncharacterized protein n=1 Tax=Vavraia culicis (isolate floridensis) TaxID=948595 RepID=L2GRJ5_VAVCU|nr:uncharacterized protein VCUG_02268 [Vavraia culicis subsp. floridensis]ELA46259.1 hypothetical protein VCUG_02268 [Vavraia culicis subsp. floridensis]